MEDSPSELIHRVRELMPLRTLNMLTRTLTEAESRVVAERQANHLLRLLGITKPSVEIELVAEIPGIEVLVIPNYTNSGTSHWAGNHWLIQINAYESLWRCRATLAHELKHILDDPFREMLYPEWPRNLAEAPRRAERLSEYFAGCVLVPKAWLHQAWREGFHSPSALASIFDVSEALMRVRLEQTGLKRRSAWGGYTRNAYRRSTAVFRNAAARLHEHPEATGLPNCEGCPL